MSTNNRVRVALIGTGGWGRHHIRLMLQQQATTHIAVVCEPNAAAYTLAAALFAEAGLKPPPNQPDLARLLARYGKRLDAAFVVTPHALHHDQVKACLETGLDVLVEKPMVMTAAEAHSLIETRDRTGGLLAVAFQGSLSPQIRKAVELLRSGALGEIRGISGVFWQNWRDYADSWRGQPIHSGGGFLFDTGAHMLNTIADLAGEDFVEVAAWLDNRDKAVDVMGTAMGRLKSGALVTIHACGDTIKSCASEIRVFCTGGILHTGMWGERLQWQRQGRKQLRAVKVPPWPGGAWEQFLAVRAGRMPNPSPPEIGLRMVRLWDAIRESAAQNGAPVQCA